MPEDVLERLREYQGKRLILGIRPEHVFGEDVAPNIPRDHMLQARVQVVEHLGSENLIYFPLGNRTVTAKVHPETHTYVGMDKVFVLDLRKAHFFDPETELAIGRE
ncbi:glycerol-3-phosphate transporter ATP-binding subunit [compost metagenome]